MSSLGRSVTMDFNIFEKNKPNGVESSEIELFEEYGTPADLNSLWILFSYSFRTGQITTISSGEKRFSIIRVFIFATTVSASD